MSNLFFIAVSSRGPSAISRQLSVPHLPTFPLPSNGCGPRFLRMPAPLPSNGWGPRFQTVKKSAEIRRNTQAKTPQAKTLLGLEGYGAVNRITELFS